MSFIKTSKEHRYSQINLDSGEKILISRGSSDTRIFRVGFLNLPKGTIHIFDVSAIANLISKIGIQSDYIRHLANTLVECKDIKEIKDKCTQLEKRLLE